MNEEAALDKFLNDILADKNLSGVNDEARGYLISDLKTRLTDQINRALIDALPGEKTDEFNTLLDDESITDEQVQQFMIDSGIDVKRIAARAMLVFRDLYMQTPEQRDKKEKVSEA